VTAVLLGITLVSECHAAFKKEVRNMDDVRTDTFTLGGPTVTLGFLSDDNPIAGGVNTA